MPGHCETVDHMVSHVVWSLSVCMCLCNERCIVPVTIHHRSGGCSPSLQMGVIAIKAAGYLLSVIV